MVKLVFLVPAGFIGYALYGVVAPVVQHIVNTLPITF